MILDEPIGVGEDVFSPYKSPSLGMNMYKISSSDFFGYVLHLHLAMFTLFLGCPYNPVV